MQDYEITYLVGSSDASKSVREIVQKAGASYKETKDWGVRDLAYPIKKKTQAHYFTGIISTLPANINEIKKKLNYDESVIRYIIIRSEQE
jgi:small subunit ribosomal protein S6